MHWTQQRTLECQGRFPLHLVLLCGKPGWSCSTEEQPAPLSHSQEYFFDGSVQGLPSNAKISMLSAKPWQPSPLSFYWAAAARTQCHRLFLSRASCTESSKGTVCSTTYGFSSCLYRDVLLRHQGTQPLPHIISQSFISFSAFLCGRNPP